MILWILGGTIVVGIIVCAGVIIFRVLQEMKEQVNNNTFIALKTLKESIQTPTESPEKSNIESSYFTKPDVQKMLEYNQKILDGKDND